MLALLYFRPRGLVTAIIRAGCPCPGLCSRLCFHHEQHPPLLLPKRTPQHRWPATSTLVQRPCQCRVRKGAGSQSGVSVWQHTLGGQRQQGFLYGSSSVALLSCSADTVFILGMVYLGMCSGLGMRLSYSSSGRD